MGPLPQVVEQRAKRAIRRDQRPYDERQLDPRWSSSEQDQRRNPRWSSSEQDQRRNPRWSSSARSERTLETEAVTPVVEQRAKRADRRDQGPYAEQRAQPPRPHTTL